MYTFCNFFAYFWIYALNSLLTAIYLLAGSKGSRSFVDRCVAYIGENALECMQTSSFLNLSREALIRLISSDNVRLRVILPLLIPKFCFLIVNNRYIWNEKWDLKQGITYFSLDIARSGGGGCVARCPQLGQIWSRCGPAHGTLDRGGAAEGVSAASGCDQPCPSIAHRWVSGAWWVWPSYHHTFSVWSSSVNISFDSFWSFQIYLEL